MPSFSNAQQTQLLVQSLLLGVGFGLVYDVLRALRRQGKCGCAATALCDALFWLVLLAGLFEFNLVFAAGQTRAFALAGTAGGALLYFSLLSAAALPLLERVWHVLAVAARLPDRFANAVRQRASQAGLPEKCMKFAKKFAKPSSLFGRKGIK